MEQTRSPVAFEVQIEGCGDFTWQGKLVAGGRATAFKSELELLLAINDLLCGETGLDTAFIAAEKAGS